MPTYDYKCTICDQKNEVIHKMSETPTVECGKCGSLMRKQFTPNRVGFAIKGGTETMAWKETRNRMKKSEQAAERQKHRWKGPRVAPNIAGVEQESWSDCQKLAKECGLDHESYKPMVEKEQKEKGPKIYTGPVISST